MTYGEARTAYEAAAAAAGLTVKGKANRYTSMNGNMFTFIDPTGLVAIRLDDAARAAFEAEHGPSAVIQYGKTMRGYVGLPPALVADPVVLADLVAKSAAHAATLKAKPTKRTPR